MNEPLKRRNLAAIVTPPQPLPDDALAAVASRNGFPAAVPPSAPIAPPVADESQRRRQRQPTGRDHQFNVRLRKDTLDFIYAQANERNIPIAQVIEEATDALRRQQNGR